MNKKFELIKEILFFVFVFIVGIIVFVPFMIWISGSIFISLISEKNNQIINDEYI